MSNRTVNVVSEADTEHFVQRLMMDLLSVFGVRYDFSITFEPIFLRNGWDFSYSLS